MLEQYFRQKYSEEEPVTAVGSYWDRKGECEIDLVAINGIDHTATIAGVKRNPDKYKPALLQAKVDKIAHLLDGYDVKVLVLSMCEM
ncbi:MAG: DUF234 domain-containing protein [Bacteroidales bacterium]|nr:DUF234 domain-containing protein [Bacteroidales bacterium]